MARWLLDNSALLVLLRSEAGVVRVHEVIAEADEILISSVSIAEVARRCKALGASPQEVSVFIEQCKLLATRIILKTAVTPPIPKRFGAAEISVAG